VVGVRRRVVHADQRLRLLAGYCDAKVANRETKVWHVVIENGGLLNDGQIQNASVQS
jgi:hypothetical protein